MTALTPEQMRELADRALTNRASYRHFPTGLATEMEAALRAAADQLEAVQELHRWLRKNIGSPALHARLDQFTAGTASDEDRDE